jgi:molybdopterin molybdotransferase
MITSAEALSRILADLPPSSGERVPLERALGRVLAETLTAREPLPAFDYSAMDGYAVGTASFSGDGPWTLAVVGESKTGAPAPAWVAGTACRIFTGAPLPEGADAVVMQEAVERDGAVAVFSQRPASGANVRRAGEDLAPGAVGLQRGTRLGPGAIGLAASLDRAHLLVARRPRVAILCTGDELRAPGDAPRLGSIPESNGPALAAMTGLAGGDALQLAFTGDDLARTTSRVREALAASDVLVTVGGVSVGEHDHVKAALEAAGATLDFWKVKIRPGKPLVVGHAGRTRVLGLPGNPVSAQVTFALFGVPLLRALQGDRQPVAPRRHARLATPARHSPGRESFLRGVLAGDEVRLLPNQASGAPTGMAWASCLLVVPAESEGLSAGEEVEVIAFADL